MDAREFTEILLFYCNRDNDTAIVDKLIEKGEKAILSGDGSVSSLINSSINGKSFSKQIQLSLMEVVNCAIKARYEFIHGESMYVDTVLPDWRCMIK